MKNLRLRKVKELVHGHIVVETGSRPRSVCRRARATVMLGMLALLVVTATCGY